MVCSRNSFIYHKLIKEFNNGNLMLDVDSKNDIFNFYLKNFSKIFRNSNFTYYIKNLFYSFRKIEDYKTTMKEVGILASSYKSENYLKNYLKNVNNQSFKNFDLYFEHIIPSKKEKKY